jgi:hypothetical protein
MTCQCVIRAAEGRAQSESQTLPEPPGRQAEAEPPDPKQETKTINTIHNKLRAFLKLLEFRIIGSAGGRLRLSPRTLAHRRRPLEIEARSSQMQYFTVYYTVYLRILYSILHSILASDALPLEIEARSSQMRINLSQIVV